MIREQEKGEKRGSNQKGLIEKVLDPSFWPIGIAVRKYFSPRSVRRQSNFQKSPDHQTQS